MSATMITTWIGSGIKIHALDTGDTGITLCGHSRVHYGQRTGLDMRRSELADAYVTCTRCRGMLDRGQTISNRTVTRRRLQARLSDGAR